MVRVSMSVLDEFLLVIISGTEPYKWDHEINPRSGDGN